MGVVVSGFGSGVGPAMSRPCRRIAYRCGGCAQRAYVVGDVRAAGCWGMRWGRFDDHASAVHSFIIIVVVIIIVPLAVI